MLQIRIIQMNYYLIMIRMTKYRLSQAMKVMIMIIHNHIILIKIIQINKWGPLIHTRQVVLKQKSFKNLKKSLFRVKKKLKRNKWLKLLNLLKVCYRQFLILKFLIKALNQRKVRFPIILIRASKFHLKFNLWIQNI